LTVLTNVTLASSNIAIPDDGDYTEICWSCFNVNFNTHLKNVLSVGVKTLMMFCVIYTPTCFDILVSSSGSYKQCISLGETSEFYNYVINSCNYKNLCNLPRHGL